MSVDEFVDICVATIGIDDNFGARDIGIHYNVSMMT
jgi:hypothetical protein